MDNGGIYQLSYDDTNNIFKNHSRATSKNKSARTRNLLSSKPTSPPISRYDLDTLLEDMKTNILHSLSMQMETMKLKMKREEAKKALTIFCLRCRKKHDKNECPLGVVEVCGICVDKNPTNKCLFLPPLKKNLRG